MSIEIVDSVPVIMSIEIVDSVPGPGQRETTVFATAVPLVKTSNSKIRGYPHMHRLMQRVISAVAKKETSQEPEE